MSAVAGSVPQISARMAQMHASHALNNSRFIYVKITNNDEIHSIYGTNSKICAAWHQFKYIIQCCFCCGSRITMINGESGRRRAIESWDKRAASDVTMIAILLRNEREEPALRTHVTALRQPSFQNLLSGEDQSTIKKALDDAEKRIRWMEERATLPHEMQVALKAIDDESRGWEERLKLLRSYLTPLLPFKYHQDPQSGINIRETNQALRSICIQMTEDPHLNSLSLATAIERFSELLWVYECGGFWCPCGVLYTVFGQYATQCDSLELYLQNELSSAKKCFDEMNSKMKNIFSELLTDGLNLKEKAAVEKAAKIKPALVEDFHRCGIKLTGALLQIEDITNLLAALKERNNDKIGAYLFDFIAWWKMSVTFDVVETGMGDMNFVKRSKNGATSSRNMPALPLA